MGASLLLALQSLRLPFLVQLAALVSSLGNYGFVWIVMGIVMLFFAEKRNLGITLIFTVLVTGLLSGFVLQPLFAQIRPCDAGIGVSAVMGVSRSGFSFPSFHTFTSYAAAMVIAMLAGRRWGIWAFVGATLIALSRMYLGVEWPLDVLAGAVLGVLVGLLFSWINNQFLHDILRDYSSTSRSKSGRISINPTSHGRRRR